MILRARVIFKDGVPDAVEEWPDAYRDEQANAWLDVMQRLYPDCDTELRQVCTEHGEEDVNLCEHCSDAVCIEYSACEECEAMLAEEACECRCPGEREAGPCHCPACA